MKRIIILAISALFISGLTYIALTYSEAEPNIAQVDPPEKDSTAVEQPVEEVEDPEETREVPDISK